MRKILFITTSNLTTNPRLYKEIQVASQYYSTTVLCFRLGNWSDAIDEQLRVSIPNTTVNYIPAHRKQFFQWLFASLSHKAIVKLWPLIKHNVFLCAAASNKRSIQLYNYLYLHKNRYTDYDLIIAHNLGALHPAQQLSKLIGVPFTFDVEDYHPGERIEKDAKHEKERREHLMRRLLPKAELVTAASPLIVKEVEKLTGVHVEYIKNSFFRSEFKFKNEKVMGETKFVWFSQNINYGRGLELFISSLDQLHGNYSLTLIGNLNHAFAEEWINPRPYIKVLGPMEQLELHDLLTRFDIGLVLELSSIDYNREIALANKIFAYLQAGLYVIATDTEAHIQLLKDYPGHGIISEQTEAGLIKIINFVLDHISQIREEKERRFQNALNLAYELEGHKLLSLWEGLLTEKKNEKNNYSISSLPAL